MDILEQAANSATNEHSAKMVVIAGFLGGVLSMSFVDGMSKRQRVVAIISGAVMAHYTSPLIASLFDSGDYQETIGFLVGLFGMSICSAIFRAIKDSDLWALFEKRLGIQPSNTKSDEGL